MLQTTDTRFERATRLAAQRRASATHMTPRATVLNAVIGGISGGIVGLVLGMVLLTSIAGIAAFGITLPLLLGLCLSGAGTILGSFVDLLAPTNAWRSILK